MFLRKNLNGKNFNFLKSFSTNVKTLKNFVNGEFVESKATKFYDITNPATGELISRVSVIQARIYNLLREFDFKPLEEIDFDSDYEKELGLDSLEWTALVTSIEHEFHTVFEDTLFDHFRTINEFVSLIEKDYACF